MLLMWEQQNTSGRNLSGEPGSALQTLSAALVGGDEQQNAFLEESLPVFLWVFVWPLLLVLCFQSSLVQATAGFTGPWDFWGRWVSPGSCFQSLQGALSAGQQWEAEFPVGVKKWPQLCQFIALEKLLQDVWLHLGCARFAGLGGCTIDCPPPKPTPRFHTLPRHNEIKKLMFCSTQSPCFNSFSVFSGLQI